MSFNQTRITFFEPSGDGISPQNIQTVLKSFDLPQVEGIILYDEPEGVLIVVQAVEQITNENNPQDLFVNQSGGVFAIGTDENEMPQKLTKEVS